MAEISLIDLVQKVGLLVALVVFFVWQTWKREKGLVRRIETLENGQREMLVRMATESACAISENAKAMGEQAAALAKFTDQIMARPCMAARDG